MQALAEMRLADRYPCPGALHGHDKSPASPGGRVRRGGLRSERSDHRRWFHLASAMSAEDGIETGLQYLQVHQTRLRRLRVARRTVSVMRDSSDRHSCSVCGSRGVRLQRREVPRRLGAAKKYETVRTCTNPECRTNGPAARSGSLP